MTLELDEKDELMIRFLLFCKREIIFETISWIVLTRNQVLHYSFSLEALLVALVIARKAFY